MRIAKAAQYRAETIVGTAWLRRVVRTLESVSAAKVDFISAGRVDLARLRALETAVRDRRVSGLRAPLPLWVLAVNPGCGRISKAGRIRWRSRRARYDLVGLSLLCGSAQAYLHVLGYSPDRAVITLKRRIDLLKGYSRKIKSTRRNS